MRCHGVEPFEPVWLMKLLVPMSLECLRAAHRKLALCVSAAVAAYDVVPQTAPAARRWLTSVSTWSSKLAHAGSQVATLSHTALAVTLPAAAPPVSVRTAGTSAPSSSAVERGV